MSDCCDPVPYRRLFNSKEADRVLKRYRKKPLKPMTSGLVEFLESEGIQGLELLEVGGGIGWFQIELLKRGVASAVNVELSSGYDEVAAALAAEEGVSDRIERRVGDFVEIQSAVSPADIVLANAVICCYPFMERMMSALVSKTGRYLVLVFPRERWWVKAALRLGELWLRLRGCGFRAFVHPVEDIERIADEDGLLARHRDNTFNWQAVIWERAA
ncbi:MAG: class I SAM-dependent methyltransferase [Acidimicrobiia bacterium]|nr:class I SAM-dependent methyltransferase [Acidimicrobiia bacterium]